MENNVNPHHCRWTWRLWRKEPLVQTQPARSLDQSGTGEGAEYNKLLLVPSAKSLSSCLIQADIGTAVIFCNILAPVGH